MTFHNPRIRLSRCTLPAGNIILDAEIASHMGLVSRNFWNRIHGTENAYRINIWYFLFCFTPKSTFHPFSFLRWICVVARFPFRERSMLYKFEIHGWINWIFLIAFRFSEIISNATPKLNTKLILRTMPQKSWFPLGWKRSIFCLSFLFNLGKWTFARLQDEVGDKMNLAHKITWTHWIIQSSRCRTESTSVYAPKRRYYFHFEAFL